MSWRDNTTTLLEGEGIDQNYKDKAIYDFRTYHKWHSYENSLTSFAALILFQANSKGSPVFSQCIYIDF